MSLATLNGHRCTRARAQIPAWGVWYAEATIDAEVALAGAVTLQLGDLALAGTVISGGAGDGEASYRIVGGAGGWGSNVAARGYANDAGVRLATVLADLAQAAGETLDLGSVAATTIGPAWTRAAAPAGRTLEQLAPESWYVGVDGITRMGRRSSSRYSGTAVRIDQDLVRGTIDLATEAIAALLPGAIVDGVEAVDVRHELSARGLRTTIWGAGVASTSRRLAAMRKLVLQVLPDYRYRGVYEYRVVTQSGERLNVQPIRVSLGMPDLLVVRVRPGVPGCRADVALGSSVLVAFVDADPSRPVVVGFEDPDGAGFVPTRLDLVGVDDAWNPATEAGRVVRYGDVITFPLSPGPTLTRIPITGVGAAGPNPVTVSRVRA